MIIKLVLIDCLAMTIKQQSDIAGLQAQINSLMQLENDINNTMIGHDTIISIS
jgi:hypothetical protein